MGTNTAKIVRVDCPEEESLHVSLSRLRRCPEEIEHKFWPPDSRRKGHKQTRDVRKSKPATPEDTDMVETDELTWMVVLENVPDTDCDEVREEEVNSTGTVSPRPSEVDDSSSPVEDRETSEEAETAETLVVADQEPSHPVADAGVNQSTAVIPVLRREKATLQLWRL